jgi:transcriptional regulator MraZ
MSTNSPHTDLFSGTVDYALDHKWRLTVPSNWRLNDGDAEIFHLVPDSNGACLRVMRRERFARYGEEARTKLDLDEKAHRAFLRQFYANSTEVTADKQGRINVPREYCDRLELRGSVKLVGSGDLFEIWNPEKLAERNRQDAAQFKYQAGELGL